MSPAPDPGALGRWLADPRDRPLATAALRSLVLLGTAALVIATGGAGWAIVLHLTVLVGLTEQFITLYHDLCHRPLLRPGLRGFDPLLRTVLGTAHGIPPGTYRSHHVFMHHPAENLWDDVSTTLPYQRDSAADFVRYYIRFFFCLVPLVRALRARLPTRPWVAVAPMLGEVGWWGTAALVAVQAPGVAMGLFVLPLVWTRSLLIIGNWAEHAFVDPTAPDDPLRCGVELIGDDVNRRSFNVGYHMAHHARPGAHFSTHPAWFDAHLAELADHDAVVLRGLHYPGLWWRLLRRDYRELAGRYVQLPGRPVRSLEEIEHLLRTRVGPVRARPPGPSGFAGPSGPGPTPDPDGASVSSSDALTRVVPVPRPA